MLTSHRSASLKRVANDVATVLREGGVNVKDILGYPNADPEVYKDVDGVLVVMTFDPAWVSPFAFVCREMLVYGKKCVFYTTIEGRARRVHGDAWIYRDLSFVANSRYTMSKLREAGATVTKVVYHGIDIDAVGAFGWRARYVRRELGLKDDDFVVGYIAGGYMRKGHDVFAEVIRLVHDRDPSIKFVVLTDSKGVEKYSGVDNVILIDQFGKLSEDEYYGLLHSFDLYAQPSLAEGFGYPVLEALAAGKPVVHADYEPLSEVTTKDTSFRVRVRSVVYRSEIGAIDYELHYYDPKDFAEMIIYAKDYVLKNRDEVRARCLERAREFDMRKTYREFLAMFSYGG